MKNLCLARIPAFIASCLFSCLFSLINISATAQVQTPHYYTSITTNSNGYYDYLPQGYNPGSSETYPLMIYLHGMGESGNGSPAELGRLLNAGPPMLINYGMFPTSFTVNGQTHKFIVLTPQFINWPSVTDIENLLNYAVANYRVNINRIYMTGISMGGGVVWDYAGISPLGANKLAAIVPVCGANYPWAPYGEVIANADLPVWATHNQNDPVVPVTHTTSNVGFINNSPNPPTPLAKMTIFPVNGHDAWTQTYNPTFTENGLNIYQWMLQYQRYFGALSVTGLEFNATKTGNQVLLKWKTQSETNNTGFQIQRSADGSTYQNIGFVNSLSQNGNGADYNFTDPTPLAAKNYYRLKQIDINTNSSYSPVRFVDLSRDLTFTIYPNPVADVLNISNSHTFNRATLRIIDMTGKVVKQLSISNNNQITVPVNGILPGVYAGEIIENTNTVRFRFVKQ